jgi:hypothetical protein
MKKSAGRGPVVARPAIAKKKKNKTRSSPMGPGGFNSRSRGALGLSGGSNRSTSRRAQVIEEDEYIGEVNGSVSFATTSYSVNPGQSGTFPWGYKIAGLYEKYDFEMLEFYFKREVSEYASNGQTGKVILSFDYDASDGAPTSKQQVEDTVPHVDGMPCSPMIRLPINCATMRNGPAKYVRPGSVPANTDIKTYDAGNFYISTYGCANTTVIGELRVKYRVRLAVPVLESTGTSNGGAQFIVQSPAAGELMTTSATDQAAFATAVPTIITNGVGATISAAGLITLPAGRYLINYNSLWSNTGVSISASQGGISKTLSTNYYMSGGASAGVATGWPSAHPSYMSYGLGTTPFILETADFGTSFVLTNQATYASGTCYARHLLTVTYLNTTLAVVDPDPSVSLEAAEAYEDRIQKLERMIACLKPTLLSGDLVEDEFRLSDVEDPVGMSTSSPPPRISSRPRKHIAVAGDRIPPAK